jgi:hypothetical protein
MNAIYMLECLVLSSFHSELFSQLDVKDPLIQLANTINWTVLGFIPIFLFSLTGPK